MMSKPSILAVVLMMATTVMMTMTGVAATSAFASVADDFSVRQLKKGKKSKSEKKDKKDKKDKKKGKKDHEITGASYW